MKEYKPVNYTKRERRAIWETEEYKRKERAGWSGLRKAYLEDGIFKENIKAKVAV